LGVAIRGDLSSTATDNQIFFWGTGNTTTSAIGFKANGGNFANPTGTGDGYNTYLTMDTSGRGWVFRQGTGGNNFTSAYTSGWILNNGIWQANASMRAPIFYDSNDTGYYVDPASKSFLSTIHFNGSVSGTGAGSEIGRNHAYDTMELKGYGAELMIGAQNASIHINYRTCNNGVSGHTPTTWYWRAGSSSSWSDHYMGLIQSSSSMRAPIFYDSNDTTYYIDPHSNTRLNGFVKIGNSSTYNSNDGNWGARLQVVSTIHARIDVGQDANAMRSTWYCHTGQSGSYFGATTGHDQYLMSHNTVRQYLYNGYSQEASSYRAPVFYDSNDTGYYADPNGTSSLKLLKTGQNHQVNTPRWDTAFYVAQSQHYYAHSSTQTMYLGESNYINIRSTADIHGDARAPIYYDRNDTGYYIDPNGTSNTANMKAYQYQGNGNVGGTGSASWHPSGIYSAGHNWLYGGINAGGASVTNMGDARANIFYDYNSTSYYLDPASTSSLVTTNIDTCNWTYGRTGSSAQSNFGLNFGTNASLYMCQSTYSSGAYYQMINDTGTPIRIRHQVSSFDTTAFTDSIVIFNHNYWRGYVGILRSPEYPLDLNGQARLSGNYTTSDIRLKENVRDNDLGLSDLLQLRTVIFDWKTDEEILGRTLAYQSSLMDCRGFIAQEVEEVVPALVDTSEGEYPTKSIDGGAVTAMMVKAIQEQQAIIDNLKARIEILENQ